MKRLSVEQLSTIRVLAENRASLKEISNEIGCCKSAIQYHVAKLRSKNPREKPFSPEKLSDAELGWLIGCYAGDGSRHFRKKNYSYDVKFALNIKECLIVERVEELFSRSGLKTWRSIEGKRVYVRCKCKALFYFFEKYLAWEGTKKSKSVRLADVNRYSSDFLFGFLCGIIDAEGGTKKLYISTSSHKLAENLIEIALQMNIRAKKYSYDVFHIYLRKADFLNACKKHNFSSIKHRQGM